MLLCRSWILTHPDDKFHDPNQAFMPRKRRHSSMVPAAHSLHSLQFNLLGFSPIAR
jgi:hypothetical protein